MISFAEASIEKIQIHKIGNKFRGEELILSDNVINFDSDNNLKVALSTYFFSTFKSEEHYRLYHDSDLSLNEVYCYASKIFQDINSLKEQSINLSKHLYSQSTHPKIKSGEFYIVYIKNAILDGEYLNAIGLFKSENKDTFLKIGNQSENFKPKTDKGININKLDKGCIIFNTEKENGFIVSVVDNTNKGDEAKYWIDDFLKLSHYQDKYFQTEKMLSLCKNYVTKELSNSIDNTDKIDLLNRSVDYFKSNEIFNKTDFEDTVFQSKSLITSFRNFGETNATENNIAILDSFDISRQAVKKQSKTFKSVLKLDKNFHVYIHGDKGKIEKGIEDDGRKYYKIYYDNEQ